MKARESEGKTVSIAIEKDSGDYNGLDVNLKIRVFNISDADVTCDINAVVNSTFYDGKKHKFVTQNVQNDVTIATGDELVFDVPVDFIQYYEARAPDDFNTMSCNVVVKCNDTQKSICDSFDFNMPNQTENPHIQVSKIPYFYVNPTRKCYRKFPFFRSKMKQLMSMNKSQQRSLSRTH